MISDMPHDSMKRLELTDDCTYFLIRCGLDATAAGKVRNCFKPKIGRLRPADHSISSSVLVVTVTATEMIQRCPKHCPWEQGLPESFDNEIDL